MSKIKFLDPRSTKTIELPSFPWSEVVIYESLLVSDQSNIESRFPNAISWWSDWLSATIAMIAATIKSTNFTDENDNDIIFGEEQIKLLPSDDLVVLTCAVTKKTPEELKEMAKEGLSWKGEAEKKNQ